MDQAIHSIKNEASKTVEIVVHVNEELNESQRNKLTSQLKRADGITDAEFCPLRWHLMLVRYDRDACSSQAVLKNIASQQIHAQLIGPV
jgi:hypothetical protein